MARTATTPKTSSKPVAKATCKKPSTKTPVAARPASVTRSPVVADKTPKPPLSRARPVAERAVAHAVALLEGCGCQYEIITRNGQRFTNRAEQPAPVTGRERVNSFVGLGYTQRVRELKVGEMVVFDLKKYNDAAQVNFRGCVASLGVTTFGRGNFATSRDGHLIEAVRLA